MNKEQYELASSKTVRKAIADNPDYKVFWRSGYAYRGAIEHEDDKQPQKKIPTGTITFEQRMERRYNWAAAIDVTIDHDKQEIHLNGFSANDLY